MKLGSRQRLQLLAPRSSANASTFGSCQVDEPQYNSLLHEAQRLRGRVYLEDGAITAREVSQDGRLVHAHDERSWQLLVMNWEGKVAGCARYIPHKDGVSFSELGISKSALACSRHWGSKLRQAVESQRARARSCGRTFAEVGGWALEEELRHSTAALEMFMNVCALAKQFGGAFAITTATIRHHSSSILRRLGGRTLVSEDGVEMPPYYDPQYRCEMEVLQFDTDFPNPRYRDRIEECRQHLSNVPAISAESQKMAYAMSS
jgi:hypothetical protein